MFRYNRPQSSSTKTQDIQTRKFLTFFLGQNEYAVDALKVQEIASYEHITQLDNSPAFVKGVCNLRGLLIPVVDLRVVFNLNFKGYNEFTVMIVIHMNNRLLGVIVDNISDVIDLPLDQIKPSEGYSVINLEFVEALGLYEERVIVILDPEKLLSREAYKALDNILAETSNPGGSENAI